MKLKFFGAATTVTASAGKPLSHRVELATRPIQGWGVVGHEV